MRDLPDLASASATWVGVCLGPLIDATTLRGVSILADCAPLDRGDLVALCCSYRRRGIRHFGVMELVPARGRKRHVHVRAMLGEAEVTASCRARPSQRRVAQYCVEVRPARPADLAETLGVIRAALGAEPVELSASARFIFSPERCEVPLPLPYELREGEGAAAGPQIVGVRVSWPGERRRAILESIPGDPPQMYISAGEQYAAALGDALLTDALARLTHVAHRLVPRKPGENHAH